MQIHAGRPGFLKPAFIIASFALLSLAATKTGHAADINHQTTPVMTAPHAGLCGHQHVLSRANYHFSYQVRHVPNLPHVRIQSFSNITQTRYEPAVSAYNIARQYCTAMVNMDNGTSFPVAYVISKSRGLTGINVDFCVDGFDRWRVHDNACRSLR